MELLVAREVLHARAHEWPFVEIAGNGEDISGNVWYETNWLE